ncbi:hypothetical protein C8Q76DRAFT_289796 [Earliella scabrosa]|nr:hypothetical protein C8Q76DRAFT_289796 [Earliella scabrosa]
MSIQCALMFHVSTVVMAATSSQWDTSQYPFDGSVGMLRDALTTSLISRFLLALARLRECQTQDDEFDDLGQEAAFTTHFSSHMSDVTVILQHSA